jgi:NADH dehydrogenase, FAD-containing subunit
LNSDAFEIVLFNRENHMVFHPLLAEVVSAAVQPKDVGAPLRQLVKNVLCRTEEVLSTDIEHKKLNYESHNGQMQSMSFDHLVLTCGNSINLTLVPGMDEHAFPLKTIGDALNLQSHVMEQMEKAEVCEDIETRRWYLTFVVVGGGFSGVEVAGEINDLVRSSKKYFNNIKEEDISVIVVHSRDQILPEVPLSLREFARQKMEQAGVTVLVNAKAAVVTPRGLHLTDERFLSGGTVVCTIGTTSEPLVDRMSLEKVSNRLKTNSDMSIPNVPYVWAVGDCAAVVNAEDGKLSPTVAQFAERQGHQVALNIVARINEQQTKPFSYKMMGQLCSIGGHSAVAEVMGMRISGFPAWFLWRGIYLSKLPSFAQQMQVGLEWACDMIFPRTLAHLKADRTKRISRAHYAAGDFVFRRGDPAADFFVIENGEVEIIRHSGEEKLDVVAILACGDFFGESSLLDSSPHGHSVRAKSEVKCTILGRNVFTQISSALAPVRTAIAKASERRRGMWHNVPDVKILLESMPLDSVMEPLAMETISINASVEHVIERMNDTGADMCCIVDQEQSIVGVVTRSNLLKAIEIAALADPDVDLPVTEIMVRNPVVANVLDPLSVSVSSMIDHELKQIPIVEGTKKIPKGRIRIEKIVALILTEMIARRKGEVVEAAGKS